MVSTTQASPDECPAFPSDEQLPALHRWTPIAVHSQCMPVVPGGQITMELQAGAISVIEVCPSCHQYRVRAYNPVPRDADGVH